MDHRIAEQAKTNNADYRPISLEPNPKYRCGVDCCVQAKYNFHCGHTGYETRKSCCDGAHGYYAVQVWEQYCTACKSRMSGNEHKIRERQPPRPSNVSKPLESALETCVYHGNGQWKANSSIAPCIVCVLMAAEETDLPGVDRNAAWMALMTLGEGAAWKAFEDSERGTP